MSTIGILEDILAQIPGLKLELTDLDATPSTAVSKDNRNDWDCSVIVFGLRETLERDAGGSFQKGR